MIGTISIELHVILDSRLEGLLSHQYIHYSEQESALARCELLCYRDTSGVNMKEAKIYG